MKIDNLGPPFGDDPESRQEALRRSHAAQPQPSKASPLGERSEGGWLGSDGKSYTREQVEWVDIDTPAAGGQYLGWYVKGTQGRITAKRSDQPSGSGRTTDDKQVNVNELVMDLRAACGDPVNLHRRLFNILNPKFDALNAALAAERQRLEAVIDEEIAKNNTERQRREQAERLANRFAKERNKAQERCADLREIIKNQLASLQQRLGACERHWTEIGMSEPRKSCPICDLLSALAVIEDWNNFVKNAPMAPMGAVIKVDLSALRKHDAEVRKPLVDALKDLRRFLAEKGHNNALVCIDDALAKVKEGQ